MADPHRDYFNRLAPQWNGMAPREPRLMEFLGRFGMTGGDRVLDVGTGTGLTATAIAACVGGSGFVVAQDFAEAMLLEARKTPADHPIHFLCSDIHGLPVRSGSFDKILCFSAFPHFRDPAAALLEMHRVLRKNGKLLILHHCSHDQLNLFHSSLEGPVRNDRLPSPAEMSRLLQAAGFDVLSATEADDVYWVEGIKGYTADTA